MSPNELAQLEHAFATDPSSDAYRPLAEAYLSMNRYMEAMVVCKKGVKAHPETPAPRVLLARVYAEQGKDKKALEELLGALQSSPADLAALRLAGSLSFKLGDATNGTEYLKKAVAANATDAETLELCKKHNVPVPGAAPPAPPPAAQQPAPAARQPTQQPAPAARQPTGQQPVARQPTQQPPVARQPTNAARAVPSNGAQNVAAQAPAPLEEQPPVLQPVGADTAETPEATPVRPRPRPQPAQQRPVSRPSRPPASYDDLNAKYGDAEQTGHHAAAAGMRGLIVTVAIILVGVLFLGGYLITANARAKKNREIAKIMQQVQAELAHDSYAGYKKACELGEKITTDLDPDLFSAHAYLAYAYALRWGEHGEGDLMEKSAREHLAKAKSAKQEHSHIYVSDAYIRYFSGDGQAAIADLEKEVEEGRGKRSALVTSTLGILEMYAGDLDKATRYLKAAHDLAPADARISSALGNALRRQGNELAAANAFEGALRYEPNHAEAQLGVALMAIDSGKSDVADKYIKRLIEADPPASNRQLAMARMAHALILDEQNKTAEADREEARAIDADSKNGELYILKARRRTRANKPDEAVAAIREAIRLEPKRASFYVELAKVLIAKPGGAKEAADSMQKALATMPGSSKLYILLGDAFKADTQFDKARDAYQKAIDSAKGGKLPEGTMALADLARDRKDYPLALQTYEKAKNEYTTSLERQAYAITQEGKIKAEQGDSKAALDLYKTAYTTTTDYALSGCLMARMFITDADPKKRQTAVALFQAYLQQDPKGECAGEAEKYAKQQP